MVDEIKNLCYVKTGLTGDVAALPHLVISLVSVLYAEVEGVQLHVEVRVEELFLDQLPDDASHLVTEHLHDGAGLNLGHLVQRERRRGRGRSSDRQRTEGRGRVNAPFLYTVTVTSIATWQMLMTATPAISLNTQKKLRLHSLQDYNTLAVKRT